MSFVRYSGFATAAIVASALTVPAPAGAALIMHKYLSLATAKAIVEESIAACTAKGYATSAVVVDADGETLVAMHGDGAPIHTMENARRKAYTAMTFKQPTAEYAKKLQDPNSVAHQQVTLPNVIAIPGGQPIKVGNEVVGGIGASGSPGFDDDCVNAGMDKVKDQLQ
ncbi:MAG: heme-binding protein [Xanthobacteraceae bacterium]